MMMKEELEGLKQICMEREAVSNQNINKPKNGDPVVYFQGSTISSVDLQVQVLKRSYTENVNQKDW